jgi:hypothetical protein
MADDNDIFAQLLGQSVLPNDDTPTMGSNWLLDGFDYDDEMNEGVLDGARLPEVRGLSKLPDGLMTTADTPPGYDLPEAAFDKPDALGMVLGEMLKDAGVQNLDWLDPTQLQDLERLPVSPTDLAIPELEEAWGGDLGTDGISFIPNRDLEAVRYEESLEEPQTAEVPGVPEREERHREKARLAKVAKQAMRLSAKGERIDRVLSRAALEVGDVTPKVRRLFAAIRSDHGLAGNVFVRASAFPGMHNGKWDDLLKGRFRFARYIVAEPGSKMAALNRYCGKRVVASVPWKKAFSQYEAKLRALGYEVDESLGHREALRRAFLQGQPRDTHTPMSCKPVDTQPAKFAAPRDELVMSAGLAQQRELRRRVNAKVIQWQKAGMLSEEAATRLTTSRDDPMRVIKAAALLITSSRPAASYEGSGAGTSLHHGSRTSSSEADTKVLSRTAKKRAAKEIRAMVTKGLLTREEARRIVSQEGDPKRMLRTAALLAAQPKDIPLFRQAEVAEYQGPVLRAAPLARTGKAKKFSTEDEKVRAAAQASGNSALEIRGMLRSLRRAMSEGFAGKQLDELLRTTVAKSTREAAEGLILEMRSEHEGLSGHLYVDAEAYATAKGVKGCKKKGAFKHIGNNIKFVRAMDRCASCTLNSENYCKAYKKVLASTFEDADKFQAEMIRLANGTDADHTASLFAPSYDPQEFKLGSELDDIQVADGLTPETIGNILFGGMDIGD